MKLKHWQGYGSVEAKVIKRTALHLAYNLFASRSIEIRVKGDHEYGLMNYDKYDIARWLGRKSLGNFTMDEIAHIEIIDAREYDNEKHQYIDAVIYKILLK